MVTFRILTTAVPEPLKVTKSLIKQPYDTQVHTYILRSRLLILCLPDRSNIQKLRQGYMSPQGMEYMHLDYSHTHYTILQNTMMLMLDNLLMDLHPK